MKDRREDTNKSSEGKMALLSRFYKKIVQDFNDFIVKLAEYNYNKKTLKLH